MSETSHSCCYYVPSGEDQMTAFRIRGDNSWQGRKLSKGPVLQTTTGQDSAIAPRGLTTPLLGGEKSVAN